MITVITERGYDPTLFVTDFSLMSEKEARFPEDVSYGSVGGPTFSTNISELTNGIEQRKINWSYPRCRYNIIYGAKSYSQIAAVVNFFYAHKGRALPFRFKDWADYKATKQNLGVGDGKTSSFRIVKNYKAGSNSFTRIITRPVEGSIKIYLDDELQQIELYSVDFKNGSIIFNRPPIDNKVVYADFEFDVLVRFDTDFLECSLDKRGTYGFTTIPLIEVKNNQ